MSNRQKKCPGCGLANFRDAVQCQWCALALRGRARTEMIDDMPRAGGKPWGLLLMLLALAIVGGGVYLHMTQKAAERAELAAEASEAADDDAEPIKRTGPPQLSGRSPSDPQPPEEIDYIQKSIEMNRENAERNRSYRRRPYDDLPQFEPRDIFGRPMPPNTREPVPRPGDEESRSSPASDDPEER